MQAVVIIRLYFKVIVKQLAIHTIRSLSEWRKKKLRQWQDDKKCEAILVVIYQNNRCTKL